MNDSIGLGRVAGIRVGAHWSLLVVFALIAWSLAVALLPADVPGQPVAGYWSVAIVTSALFLASLLAHEMGHALLARRAGLEIDGVTLWLFGGVTRFRSEAMSPGTEVRISIVGPAVSLALALLFALIAVATNSLGAPGLAGAAAVWLALINGILGLFNLLPAFPLDGGRVLRALLWMRWGQLTRATVTAGRVGQAAAYVLIGVGIAFFFVGDTLDGVWLAFIGWFLLVAARAEAEGTAEREALAGLRVAEVMSPDPFVAPGWITVDELIRSYLLAHRYSTFPVKDFEGRLQGLVTLARLKVVAPERRAATRVADVALPLSQVVSTTPTEPLTDLVGRLHGGAGGRALVFEDGRLVGIVSPADIARALAIASLRSKPDAARARRV